MGKNREKETWCDAKVHNVKEGLSVDAQGSVGSETDVTAPQCTAPDLTHTRLHRLFTQRPVRH